MRQTQPGSVIPDEIAKFDGLAARWWDPSGPMAPLHAMNEVRVGWIAARLPGPCRLLDVGCGGGLASEALAALGHQVTGIDAAGEAIGVAEAHAAGRGLDLRYLVGTAEALVDEGERFAAVTALEVIEHVADPGAFLRTLAALLEPGGAVFLSTLNRTAASLAVAKIGAEYVARLLPAGTHDWRRFLSPAELDRAARGAGLRLAATAGLSYDLRRRVWRESRDLSINYIAQLTRT